jgi:signal transduction histidine kinase
MNDSGEGREPSSAGEADLTIRELPGSLSPGALELLEVRVRESAAEAARAHRHAAELEAMTEAIADGLVVFGPSGEPVRVNATARAFAREAGIDLRSLVFDLDQDIRSADGRATPREERPVRRALAGETVRGVHLRVQTGSGRALWVLASAAPVRDPDGKVSGAVLTFSDETGPHELEGARDDLVRMISHDLRTPLHAVYVQAHLLQRGGDDPAKVRERARSIVRSCERMSGMIQDLVDATLLEAGQLPLRRAPVELGALLPELLERLRGALDVDRVRLEIAPGLPSADLDPARVERIVVNLVSNALKYSPPESQVAVALTRDEASLVLTVSDRGVGIAPEDQPHVFERFFRARGGRRPEGLGLGLYIARLLAEAHGGAIDVESQLGQGSTFRVRFPAGATAA